MRSAVDSPRGSRLAARRAFRLLIAAASLALAPASAHGIFFRIAGGDPGSWPEVLSSLGFKRQAAGGDTAIFVLREGAAGPPETWLARAQAGAFLVVEGQSAVASALGFRTTKDRVRVRSVEDLRQPQLRIIWEQALEMPVFEVPTEARVFARERFSKAPLLAGFERGAGGVLWVAAPPGEHGYERFPYLMHALVDLGCQPPFRSRRLWAFFDPAYRARVDLEYFARRWRTAGIAALHVAAWHYYDRDEERDRRLAELIAACHRHGILVYAWLELPHVSEKFWEAHAGWREKTATLQDAHLDWRRLMNLVNRDCFHAASAGMRQLLAGFDWDGVNLAELYFESLEGAANPSRFTPMNDDVRREFRAAHGFDPLDLFKPGGSDANRLRQFLDYRASLARRIETEWIEELETVRRDKPDLDLVLTHVDDRFDTGMRDLIGADAAAALPLAEQHDVTFMVEDPATVWNLGPQRYPEIAKRYQPLTQRPHRLAIDINVVERYQDVYPTKQQTGVELFQLVRLASESFARVALYFENSILPQDWPHIASAGAAVSRVERSGGVLVIESPHGAGVRWKGAARVDGRLWPAADEETVWLPPGAHSIQSASEQPPVRLLDFNGELNSASVARNRLEFAYQSASRAIAILDQPPVRQEIDGAPAPLDAIATDRGRYVILLPRGQHLVSLEAEGLDR